MKDVDERVGIPSDRTTQSRCQHLAEAFIACRCLGDCGGENATHDDCQLLGIVQHLAEVPRQFDLTAKQQSPQLLKPRIEWDDARRLYADISIDIPGQLEQQPRKHLAIKAGFDRGGREQPLERSGRRAHLTSRRELAGRYTAQRLDARAGALRSHILVEALGDFDEQARE
jgi:hypothetical protein